MTTHIIKWFILLCICFSIIMVCLAALTFLQQYFSHLSTTSSSYSVPGLLNCFWQEISYFHSLPGMEGLGVIIISNVLYSYLVILPN